MLFARVCPTATVQTERARPYSLTMPSSRQRRGLAFAVKLVAIQIAGSCSYLMRFGRGHQLTRNFQRVLAWTLLSGVVWLAGGVADDAPRVVLWLIAVAVDYTAPMHGFAAPPPAGMTDQATIPHLTSSHSTPPPSASANLVTTIALSALRG